MLSRMLKDNSDYPSQLLLWCYEWTQIIFSIHFIHPVLTKQRCAVFVGSGLSSCSSAWPAIPIYSLKCGYKVGGEGWRIPKPARKFVSVLEACSRGRVTQQRVHLGRIQPSANCSCRWAKYFPVLFVPCQMQRLISAASCPEGSVSAHA